MVYNLMMTKTEKRKRITKAELKYIKFDLYRKRLSDLFSVEDKFLINTILRRQSNNVSKINKHRSLM